MATYHYGTRFGDDQRDEFVPEWKQEARDDQGRRRFHGAFTGGFSAGYFNSVGSKQGWTPSSFKSSRSNPAKRVRLTPQDFMDEEDIAQVEETKTLSRTNIDNQFTSSVISVNPTAHDKYSRGSRILDGLDSRGLIKPMPDILRGWQMNKAATTTNGLGYGSAKLTLPCLRSDSLPKSIRSIRKPKSISNDQQDDDDDYIIRPSTKKKKQQQQQTAIDNRLKKTPDTLPGFVLALSSLSLIPDSQGIHVPDDFKPNPQSRPGNDNSKLRRAKNIAAKLSNKANMILKRPEPNKDYEGSDSIRQTMANRFVSATKPGDMDDRINSTHKIADESKPLEIGQSRRTVTSFAPAPLVCKRFNLPVPETTQHQQASIQVAASQQPPPEEQKVSDQSIPVVSQDVDLFASIFGS